MQYLLTEEEYDGLKFTHENLGLMDALYFSVNLLAYCTDKKDGDMDKQVGAFMAKVNGTWDKNRAIHPITNPMLSLIACAKQYEKLAKWAKENKPELLEMDS